MKRENSEKLQQIIKLIHEKKTNREIKVELTPMFGNLGDSTIRWARTVDQREETLQRGRKRKISEEIDDNSRETIKQGPAGRTNKDIKAVIDDELKKKREANNRNPYSIPSISASTYYRAIRRIAPEVEKNAVSRAPEREVAMEDMYSAISHVAVSHAIQNVLPTESKLAIESEVLRIHPAHIFNFDTVSCVINGELNENVRLPAGTKARCRQQNITPSYYAPRIQRRSIKQLYLTSADGYLHAAVVIIKDRSISTLQFHRLGNQGGYELWLVYSPKVSGNVL